MWNWPGPIRTKAFLWKLCHGKLMTNVARRRKGLTTDDTCPRCHSCPETIIHMIRDCEEVKEFLSNLIDPDNWSKFFRMGFHSWLDWNLSSKLIGTHHSTWPIVFGTAINDIWKKQNSLVFLQVSNMGRNLYFQVLNQASFIMNLNDKSASTSTNLCPTAVVVNWCPPPDGCFKINVDGSHTSNPSTSACGGLARDANGNFVKGFFMPK